MLNAVTTLEELLPVITCLSNSSLLRGYFPTSWKEALVDPRLKKTAENVSFPNLRPVSNLYQNCMSYSSRFHLIHGVPQGSCLGPWLSTIYASKLCDVVKAYLPNIIHAYADDNQLYQIFRADSSVNQMDAMNARQDVVKDIKD